MNIQQKTALDTTIITYKLKLVLTPLFYYSFRLPKSKLKGLLHYKVIWDSCTIFNNNDTIFNSVQFIGTIF